jgi:signal transduction histidine kinase
VQRLTHTIREQSGIEIELEARLGEDRLPQDAETALYRVIQEAFTNVVKHSGARRVSVILQRVDGVAMAVVEDDGAGFDPLAPRGDAIGLEGMRERLALVGGRLRIESSSGSGTTLVAEVPAA